MSETVASTRTAALDHRGRGPRGRARRPARVRQPGRSQRRSSPRSCSRTPHGFVDAARAARAAQRGWAAVPAPVRGRVIAQVGRLVEANKEALARLVTREIGKPYAEALGEVQEIIDTCDFFLGEGRRLYGQTVPSEMPDKQLFTFRMPVGVAAIVTAGNFPVAVPSWYLVPAILCGNAVVWKPAEYAAATGTALARLFHAGGVPGGVLEPRPRGRGADVRRPRARAGGAARRQGRLHRLVGGGRGDRRALRPPPAVAVPGARRQEPDGGDGRRRPRPGGRGRPVRAASAPPASAARRSARRSSRPASTTSSSAGSTRGCARRRSATRRRTCSTARCCTSASPSASRSGSG